MRSRSSGVLAAMTMLIAACGGGGDSAATSTSTPTTMSGPAQDGAVVGVFYTGTLDDGTEFDSNVGGAPLVFTLGTGAVIAGFEDAVRGRSVGETFTVRIEAANAYGERSDANIVDLPAEGAPAGLQVGDSVQLSSGATVVVTAIGTDTITVDTNHPLAGQALTFEITIDSIDD